jgi:5-hydroxyisourate hydrolase
MTGVSTHVLDAARGAPAVGVPVVLTDASGGVLAESVTDSDGRITGLLPPGSPAGNYRLTFDTGHYFDASGTAGFYPEVVIVFTVADPSSHYHVPVLLSPFAYSTYRGS